MKPFGCWTYSIAWGNPYTTPTGPRELACARVPAGECCPPELLALSKPGDGYTVHLNFEQREIKPWPPERKAAARKRALERRVLKAAPLFADELIGRELAARADYFAGKSTR